MTLTSIGTAGSGSQLGRDSSAHLLQFPGRDGETKNVMLDFGASQGTLDEYVDSSQLDAIFLTHGHPDHIAGFADWLVTQFWLSNPQALKRYLNGERGVFRKLPVYGPLGIEQEIERLVNLADAEKLVVGGGGSDLELVPQEAIKELIDFREYVNYQLSDNKEDYERPLHDPNEIVIGDVQVSAAFVQHSVEAFAIRFDHPEFGSLCYSGDTGPTPNLVELARGADVLLQNAPSAVIGAHGAQMHSSPEEAGACATEAEVGRLVLSHLNARQYSPNWDQGCTTPTQRRKAMRETWKRVEKDACDRAATTFSGPITPARPDLAITVRTSPASRAHPTHRGNRRSRQTQTPGDSTETLRKPA